MEWAHREPKYDYSMESYEDFRAEVKDAYPNVTINYPWDDEEEING